MVAHRNSAWQNRREIQQHIEIPFPQYQIATITTMFFFWHWIYIHYQVPVGYVSLGNPILRREIPLSNTHGYSQYKGIQYQSPTNHQWLHDDNSWESPTLRWSISLPALRTFSQEDFGTSTFHRSECSDVGIADVSCWAEEMMRLQVDAKRLQWWISHLTNPNNI